MKLDKYLWDKIHRKAARAKDDNKKQKYVTFMKKVYKSIKCSECKGHMKNFLRKEQLISYYHIDNGFFIWSWKFHNDVNNRIGKSIISYEDAYKRHK